MFFRAALLFLAVPVALLTLQSSHLPSDPHELPAVPMQDLSIGLDSLPTVKSRNNQNEDNEFEANEKVLLIPTVD